MIKLGHVERGTKMSIYEDIENNVVGDEYEAVFRHVESERTFIVLSPGLYNNFGSIRPGSTLRLSFISEPNTYTFTGRALEKQRTNGLVLIEQLTGIETFSSRQYDRDELRLHVMVYGLPEAQIGGTVFIKPYNHPDLSDVTYDISVGGVCVISNTMLKTAHDPYYLVEFSLSDKDRFLLPAKLVRRINCPRTKIGRYDYGFQFIFEKIPEEKGRLSRSILNKKLSAR